MEALCANRRRKLHPPAGLHGAPRTTSRAACSPTVCFTNAQAQAREPVPQGTVTVRFSTHFKVGSTSALCWGWHLGVLKPLTSTDSFWLHAAHRAC